MTLFYATIVVNQTVVYLMGIKDRMPQLNQPQQLYSGIYTPSPTYTSSPSA